MTLHFTIMGRHQAVRKISIVSQRREAEGFKIDESAKVQKLEAENAALKQQIEELQQQLQKAQYELEWLYVKETQREDEEEIGKELDIMRAKRTGGFEEDF